MEGLPGCVQPEGPSLSGGARKSAVAHKIKATGEQHQYDGITPVFSDGSTFAMTFRSWGDFMAAVWSEEEDTDMSYMDFYI